MELDSDLLVTSNQVSISLDLPWKLRVPFQRSPQTLNQGGAKFGFFLVACHYRLSIFQPLSEITSV